MRPCPFRPPLEWSGRTRDFSGSERVISAKSLTLEPRRPGVVGLYLRMPIFFVHSFTCVAGRSGRTPRTAGSDADDVDPVAVGHLDDGALGVRALPVAEAGPLPLALAVDRVHGVDLHRDELVHRAL